MTTLKIADLSANKTLGEAAMARVVGGCGFHWSLRRSAFTQVGYWHTDPTRLIWSFNISYHPPLR